MVANIDIIFGVVECGDIGDECWLVAGEVVEEVVLSFGACEALSAVEDWGCHWTRICWVWILTYVSYQVSQSVIANVNVKLC